MKKIFSQKFLYSAIVAFVLFFNAKPAMAADDPVPALDPTWFLADGITITSSSVGFTIQGCGNGTPVEVMAKIVKKSDRTTTVMARDFGYQGSGDFLLTHTFSDLQACEDYVLQAYVTTPTKTVADSIQFNLGCVLTTVIDDVDHLSLEIYPNPVSDIITITSDRNLGKVSFFSIIGQHVFSHEFSSEMQNQEIKISVKDLPAGEYFFISERFKKKFLVIH